MEKNPPHRVEDSASSPKAKVTTRLRRASQAVGPCEVDCMSKAKVTERRGWWRNESLAHVDHLAITVFHVEAPALSNFTTFADPSSVVKRANENATQKTAGKNKKKKNHQNAVANKFEEQSCQSSPDKSTTQSTRRKEKEASALVEPGQLG